LVAAGASYTSNISVMTLPAGDWDCSCWCESQPNIGMQSMTFQLNPLLPECSNWMVGADWSGAVDQWIVLVGQSSRINTANPLLIAFTIVTGGAAAQSLTFGFEARRAR
jgi:hypothetical protein